MILFTCEHGGNSIPEAYTTLFQPFVYLLNSHRGLDFGALEIYQEFTQNIAHTGYFSTISRLLIELNRSVGHPKLFSEITRPLSTLEKESLLQQYYLPYRLQTAQTVRESIQAQQQVLHISFHSFTPIFNEQTRSTDIGLLYDPQRQSEKEFAMAWKQSLQSINPRLKIQLNQPYQGNSDGLTTALRQHFPTNYRGLELEVNQRFFFGIQTEWQQLKKDLLLAFKQIAT